MSVEPTLFAARGSNAPGPASPCVRNCCLDGDDICLGCGRSLEDILAWHRVDAAGREAILGAATIRMQARNARRAAT